MAKRDIEQTQTMGRLDDGEPAHGALRLVLVSGPDAGRRYIVGGVATLGRSSGSTIVVPDPYVSRQQARVERDDKGTAFLVDVSGRGNLKVNGTAHLRGALWFGDKIQVGNTTILVVPHDVTEGVRLEQDRIQALGYLSSGIAHDFNNMLAVILSTLSYLKDIDPDTPIGSGDVHECLADIFSAGERSRQLVERILTFARKEKESHELVDLGEICAEVIQLAERGSRKTVQVQSEIEDKLWVRGARAQLAQLVMNLCINACDAMPAGGVLRVTASKDGEDVQLVVEDTGIGMDAETREHIFERFFTTKEADGTGLGLATVVEVARWHGGGVSVRSEPGKGTRFEVRIPVAHPTRQRQRQTSDLGVRAVSKPRPGRILIVDDDPMVRRSMVRLLRRWGHDTIDIGDPRRAVETYRAKAPDLVLLDLDMPGMDGQETWQELRVADPQVQVAFVSGHSASDWEDRLLRDGALGFLQKPFEVGDLRTFVRTALAFSTQSVAPM